MHRNAHFGIALAFLLFSLFAAPLPAEEEDLCSKTGIIVRNMTMNDLWYKKDGGDCMIWIHEHIFRIKPKDNIEIFSDLACTKKYCHSNLTYGAYKSLDANGDCGIKILPYCNLSDM